MIAENLERLKQISVKYLNRIEKEVLQKTDSEEESQNEEEKEKLRRVVDFICATSKKIEENPSILNNNNEPYSANNKITQLYLDEHSPPHSSDSEIEEQFISNLMDIFAKANFIPRPAQTTPPTVDSSDFFKNK